MTRIDFMEPIPIRPVALDRVKRLHNGQRIAITADVGGVASALKEVDDRFVLSYQPQEALYVLELHEPQGDGSINEHFVGAYEELDARIVERARMVASPQYNLAEVIERAEAAAAKEHDAARAERMGDAAERLAFAIEGDLGRHEISRTRKSRAFIPPAFRPGR